MSWPRDYHPVVDGQPDRDTTVRGWALEPGGEDDLTDWTGGQTMLVNGAAAVLLPGTDDSLVGRIVGLGDVAIETTDGVFVAEPGGGLAARYLPVDADEAPPADGPEHGDE